MGLFDFLSDKKNTKKLPENVAEKVLIEIKHQISKPCISLIFKDEETSVFNSKIAGEPFLPEGFIYPVDKSSGEPLVFLAQINFSELPHIKGFPANGILQFYIKDKMFYGMDFDNRINQNSFRVCFHPGITGNETTYSSPVKTYDKEMFPVHKTCKIEGRITTDYISHWIWNFREKLLPVYQQVTGSNVDTVPEKVIEFIEENLHPTVESKIGGYPSFTQEDPRYEYKDYSILLLQLVSEESSGLMWGDCGIANFFITPDDFKRLDFDNVLYSWDCY